ncbi:MAG: Rieske (2Fe-2S) protein [Prolixibacteraceae bacterium]|jgi:cytochrome b6-f complex iron-sulfur subunit|nr:Rieske (2Fe-2S) protein [Prolixibacteraceae bacterium]
MKKFIVDRRKFLRSFFYALLSFQLIYVFVRLLKIKIPQNTQSDLYDAGDISFFENGKMYPFGSAHFFLHRFEDGGFIAVSSKCTHLGCAVQLKADSLQLECPCHASAFNSKGEVLSPPASRPLDYYPIVFKDGKVLVNIAHPVRRNKFEQAQIKYI